jgi:DNA transposition AAA+ family ATPase
MTDQHAIASLTPGTFLLTKEVRRFAEFCDAVRRYRYIGLCYGPAGVGKSLSARHYARWDLVEPCLTPDPFAPDRPTPPELASCRSIVYTPTVTTTPKRLGDQLDQLCRSLSWAVEELVHVDDPQRSARRRADWVELIQVDEADRLKLTTLEELRDRYDRGRFGLVLIGMPGIEKRLARYAQFYSRVGFVHEFRLLAGEELRFVLAYQWQQLGLVFDPDDASDVAALALAAQVTRGNFRLIERLFAQVERILSVNQLRQVSPEVVEAAREGLVIGPG